MPVFKHFIGKINHGNVKFNSKHFTDVRQIVKKVGVPAFEMDRNNIALALYTFNNERFFPFQIFYNAFCRREQSPAGNIIRWLSDLNPASTIAGKFLPCEPVLFTGIKSGARLRRFINRSLTRYFTLPL